MPDPADSPDFPAAAGPVDSAATSRPARDNEPMESADGSLTVWQKRMLWRAVTGLALACLLALLVAGVWLIKTTLGFLQPVLVPLAVAGVIAFLLDPLISKLHHRGMSRKAATATVLGSFLGFVGLLLGTVIPLAVIQGQNFIENWPNTVSSTRNFFNQHLLPVAQLVGVDLEEVPGGEGARSSGAKESPEGGKAGITPDGPAGGDGSAPSGPAEGAVPPAGSGRAGSPSPAADGQPAVRVELDDASAREVAEEAQETDTQRARSLHQNTPFDHFIAKLTGEENRQRFLSWAQSSLQGVFGILGYLVGFLLVPVYLFFFLKERTWIKRNWREMIPLRSGRFKDELADVLQEINGYLIAFFRGQVVVSVIDGVLTAILLQSVGLPYGLVIGFALAIIGIIPFVGIIVTMIPAVIVAFATASQHDWAWVQTHPWGYALLIVGIFFAVQQFDGLVIQPKIVGDATGLHPMTIILSVVFWSFLLGGVLGAILAVPLSAALKVLLKRYVWDRPLGEQPPEEDEPKPPPRAKRGAANPPDAEALGA